MRLCGPNGSFDAYLLDTAYVPSFHTNVVSFHRVRAQGVHWDTRASQLTYKGKTFATVFEKHGQFVLEYTPSSAFPVSSHAPKATSKADVDLWHRRMGHLDDEAVRHLPTAATGVELTSSITTSKCVTCKLSKATQQISRCPTDRAQLPFARVHLDLVQMNPAYNGNRWILHFLDDFSRMNYVYTMTSKSATLDTVQNFAALVRNQYALTVKVLRLDGESTLQNLFLDWTESNGLVVERSAPYCPQQNGAAE